jgi:NADH dehydrogenase [ubiquinone] 1 alpha subcomplex assembly factor 2
MPTPPGPIRRAWYEWKMLRFPWRKRWLVGFDLEGNTFWEFKDALHALRNRRIAKYHRSTHYGDVNVSRASCLSSIATRHPRYGAHNRHG